MSSARTSDRTEFAPTLREVMWRPAWLALLALAMIIAAVFAWLGQWQLGNAIDTDPPPPGMTEQVRPLAEVSAPGEYLPDPYVGQRVEVTGSFVAGDFALISSRYNGGEESVGFWVAGQLRIADTDSPTSLAVAVGWTDNRAVAEDAIASLNAAPPTDVTLEGRLISDEGPVAPADGQPITEMTRMSPVALLGMWSDVEDLDVYRPYLAAAAPLGGLEAITSPAPEERSAVNWLNIFYAVEWAIFAGFAFYMWYRLARDAWEKEVEDFNDARAAETDSADTDAVKATTAPRID